MSKTKKKKKINQETYDEIIKEYNKAIFAVVRSALPFILAVCASFVCLGAFIYSIVEGNPNPNFFGFLLICLACSGGSFFFLFCARRDFLNAKIDKLEIEKKLAKKREREEKKKSSTQQKEDTAPNQEVPKKVVVSRPENQLKGHYEILRFEGKNADDLKKAAKSFTMKLDIQKNYVAYENFGAFKLKHIFDPETGTSLVEEQEIEVEENGEMKTIVFPETENKYTYNNEILTLIRPNRSVAVYKKCFKKKKETVDHSNTAKKIGGGIATVIASAVVDAFLDN